jgi:cell division protein FtsW (lipid II flippase)
MGVIMSASARSLFVVGGLLAVLGVAFVLVPAVPAAVLGFPSTAGAVVRLLGVVVAALGAYYVISSRWNDRTLIRASVPVRAVAGTVLLLLVVAGAAPRTVLAFVLLEYGGSAWTAASLRHEPTSPGKGARRIA